MLTSEPAAGTPWHRSSWYLMGLFVVLVAVLIGGRWFIPNVGLIPNAHETPPPSGPSRPAAYTPCPELVLTFVPEGFVVTERKKHALRDNHMGEIETYTKDPARITTYAGVDAIDVLEDMELVGRPVRAAGRTFVVHHTAALPGLLLAELQDDELEEPCDSFAVLTYGLSADVMPALLAGLDIRERSGQWGVPDRSTE